MKKSKWQLQLLITFSGSWLLHISNRYDLAHIEPEEIKSKASPGIVKKFAEPDFVSEELVSERLVELDKDDIDSYPSEQTNNISTHLNREPNTKTSKKTQMKTQVKMAIEKGYTGDICPECQSMTMVRNGTCLKCMTCGSTSGCS